MGKQIYHADMIARCAAYCERAGIKETTFGQKVLRDRNFLARLRAGGQCLPRTELKVLAFLSAASNGSIVGADCAPVNVNKDGSTENFSQRTTDAIVSGE